MRRLATMAILLGLAGPALAAEASGPADPVKLDDHELDEVAAGEGSLLPLNLDVNVLLKDISVAVNVSNVPINAGVVVQANAIGQAIQNATVIAGQQVTQAQSFGTLR